MNEQATREPVSDDKPAKHKSTRGVWIVRGVVGVLLAVGVVLALIDYRAKSQATQTADKWMSMIGEENKVLEVKDLEAEMVGSPEIATDKDGTALESAKVYTWPGIIRSYRIRVITTLKGTVVRKIDGPHSE